MSSPSPKLGPQRTEQVLVDTVGVLAVKLEEMRSQRDWHERFIHEKYEVLFNHLRMIRAMIEEIHRGYAKRQRKVGAKGKEEYGTKRDSRQPAPGSRRAGGRKDRRKQVGRR